MKKRRPVPGFAMASLFVGVLLLLSGAPASAEGALSGVTVCLDPGHGGSDPGAVYDDGSTYLEEADVNLDVAYGLKALLEGEGAAIGMTRTGDQDKSNSDRYTYCNNLEATILVSVHTNSVDDPTWDGSLTLYFHRDDDKLLAQAIHDVLYPALLATAPDPAAFRDFGLSRFASGVLLKSDMPAAMMEPLFMSHPAEAALLATPIYLDAGLTPNPACDGCRRAQIAQAVYEGVLSYFGSGTPNQPPTADFTYAATDLTVSLTDTSSDSDGEVVSWSWELGDGGTSTEQNPSHTYADAGTYTVSLTVTDDDGATGTISKPVTVGTVPNTMHIGDLEGSATGVRNQWTATMVGSVHDAAHNPVTGATVSGTWSGGYSGSGSCTTDASGQCAISTGDMHKSQASVTWTVDGVTHATLAYDAAANHDPDGDGSSVTVYKP